MLPAKDIGCHRTGFQKTCFECVTQHSCRLWTHIVGTDPQTGAPFDVFGCSDEFTNKLLIENSQMQRQTGAAVESFRNEMIKRNDIMLSIAAAPNGRSIRQIEGQTMSEEGSGE